MIVQPEGRLLPVTKAFTTILQQLIDQSAIDTANGVVINFRDPDYSAKYGGYHPVEVAINQNGALLYITDFAYAGHPPFAELAKEIDFDFSCQLFQHYGIDHPLIWGKALYRLWQSNFCAYYKQHVYQTEVTSL
jgi:hypothetical protein